MLEGFKHSFEEINKLSGTDGAAKVCDVLNESPLNLQLNFIKNAEDFRVIE